FASRRRHTRSKRDWSSDVCSSDLDQIGRLDYASLQPSAKFTPALYVERDGVWEGGSVSHFSPVLTFTLYERFSSEGLEVSESMEMNGRPTFGYGEPILYKRAADPAQ